MPYLLTAFKCWMKNPEQKHNLFSNFSPTAYVPTINFISDVHGMTSKITKYSQCQTLLRDKEYTVFPWKTPLLILLKLNIVETTVFWNLTYLSNSTVTYNWINIKYIFVANLLGICSTQRSCTLITTRADTVTAPELQTKLLYSYRKRNNFGWLSIRGSSAAPIQWHKDTKQMLF